MRARVLVRPARDLARGFGGSISLQEGNIESRAETLPQGNRERRRPAPDQTEPADENIYPGILRRDQIGEHRWVEYQLTNRPVLQSLDEPRDGELLQDDRRRSDRHCEYQLEEPRDVVKRKRDQMRLSSCPAAGTLPRRLTGGRKYPSDAGTDGRRWDLHRLGDAGGSRAEQHDSGLRR